MQWVNRPNNPTDKSLHDFRGLSGQIASGIVRRGQQVVVLPAGIKTTVKEIWTYDGSLAEAFCPQSVTLCLEHDIDISRGDMIVGLENLPGRSAEFQARVCWMNQRPLQAGQKIFSQAHHADRAGRRHADRKQNQLRHARTGTRPAALAMNDIGGIRLKTAKPLVFDGYQSQPADRLVHFDRAGHERDRRRRDAAAADRSREAGIFRLRDLTPRFGGGRNR